MSPALFAAIVGIIGELPAATQAVEDLILTLRQQPLTPGQIADLEAAEAAARQKWAADLAEDAPQA